MIAYLPTVLIVEADLNTAIVKCHAFRVACERTEWTRTNTDGERARAYETICARVRAAYDRLDLGPTSRETMAKEMKHSRTVAAALREEVARLQEENRRLTAANVDLLHGRAA